MTTNTKSSAAAGAAEDKVKTSEAEPTAVPAADTTAADIAGLRAELATMRAKLAEQNPAVEPVVPAEPEDPTHVVQLACGDSFKLPNPHSTHHHCTEHDALVPVTAVYPLAS